MLNKLFYQNCRFLLITEYPCEESFWKTLDLPGIYSEKVPLTFFHDLSLPNAPTVGVYYNDGNWGTTPESVSYNPNTGWTASQKFIGDSDVVIKTEEQLKSEIAAYGRGGWKCVNQSLLIRLGLDNMA